MENRKLNRRDFLRLSTAAATGALIASCAPATPMVIEKEVIKEVPVEKAVIVEREIPREVIKEVIKEVPVEKVVEKEVVKEVEKVVTVTPRPVEKVELVFMSPAAGGLDKVWYEENLPVFQEKHPHIHVDFTPEVGNDKVIAAMVAGDAPDIFMKCCQALPEFAEKGVLLDLQDYMDRDLTLDDIDDWYPYLLAFWQRDEEPVGQFAIPHYTGTLGLFYNVDMFDEAGVDYPPRRWKDAWSHDEYLETMLKMVKKDASGKTMVWGSGCAKHNIGRQMPHVVGFGGYQVDPEDNTRCALGEPPAQEALWWMYDRTWEDDGYPQSAEVPDLSYGNEFVAEKTAMSEEGAWKLFGFCEQITFKWNYSPFPKGPVNHVTLAGTTGDGMWTGTKHPDEAWEVMKFITSRYYGRVLAKYRLRQPARKSILYDFYQIVRDQYPTTGDVDLEVFGEAIVEGYARPQELFRKTGATMEVYSPAMERIFITGTDTPDILKNGVCEEITRINRAD